MSAKGSPMVFARLDELTISRLKFAAAQRNEDLSSLVRRALRSELARSLREDADALTTPGIPQKESGA